MSEHPDTSSAGERLCLVDQPRASEQATEHGTEHGTEQDAEQGARFLAARAGALNPASVSSRSVPVSRGHEPANEPIDEATRAWSLTKPAVGAMSLVTRLAEES